MLQERNKIPAVLISALAMFVVMIMTSLFSYRVFGGTEALVAAVSLMCIAIPFHIFGKKIKAGYYFSFFLNSLSVGLAVSGYYIIKKIRLEFSDILFPVFLAFILLALAGLAIYLVPKSKKTIIIIALSVMLVFLVFAVVNWIKINAVFYSYVIFSIIVSLIWLAVFNLTVGKENRNILRDISFGSFGIATVIAIVVITIVTEDSVAVEVGCGVTENTEAGTTKKKRG